MAKRGTEATLWRTHDSRLLRGGHHKLGKYRGEIGCEPSYEIAVIAVGMLTEQSAWRKETAENRQSVWRKEKVERKRLAERLLENERTKVHKKHSLLKVEKPLNFHFQEASKIS